MVAREVHPPQAQVVACGVALPWNTVATVATAEGALELRQRGETDFLISIAGRVLMTSAARRSEEALATVALAERPASTTPRVLIGGLGMGYTLRAALDALPPTAKVEVAELTRAVVTWCQGPLSPLTKNAVADRRTRVWVGDVAKMISNATPGCYHAILLDLYEGPYSSTQPKNDPHFGDVALAKTVAALADKGVLAVWGEDRDPAFSKRLAAAGMAVKVHRTGKGGRAHIIYVGTKLPTPPPRTRPRSPRPPRRR